MSGLGRFPFGQPVRAVVQENRTPKRAFLFRAFASSVQARWIGPGGKEVVRALAVASEPRIFWRGEHGGPIIEQVDIPGTLGRLVPADHRFNRPSGIALDERILNPLGLSRDETWLCDLVPHSCMNTRQKSAIEREYAPLVPQYGLPATTMPPAPDELADISGRESSLKELQESQAEFLILLGDQPIRWFLTHYEDRWKRLSNLGEGSDTYGRPHKVQIDTISLQVLPLAHPGQIATLGRSSARRFELHQHWFDSVAPDLLN
jgi:hypothetical protein